MFKLYSNLISIFSHYGSYTSSEKPQGKEILSMKIVLERKNFIDKNLSGKSLVVKNAQIDIHFIQKKLKT